jgi:hypothetical protein
MMRCSGAKLALSVGRSATARFLGGAFFLLLGIWYVPEFSAGGLDSSDERYFPAFFI